MTYNRGATLSYPGGNPWGWRWLGKVLHDGTYHRDLRIETTRRGPPRSGPAAPSWLLACLASPEWPWRLARAGGTALSRRSCHPGARVRSSTETILASLNTHGGRGADGRPYDLEAACRQFKADIIVLQEAWRPHDEPNPVDEIATALGAEPLWTDLIRDVNLHSVGIVDERAPGRWGLATLTTAPVLGFEVTDLGRIPGDVTPRAAQLVTVELPGGGPLRIVNTHLTYRLLSPVQLIRLVRRLIDDDIPTVIAGDLNMPLPVTGLAAGYAPAVSGRTYPAHRPVLQLDHILANRQVARCGGEVLPPAGSDHLPVRARLRLR